VLPVVVMGPSDVVRTNALVDTGSSASSVDEHVLQRIGALRQGTTRIVTVTGPSQVPVYRAQVQTEAGTLLVDHLDEILGDHLPGDVQVLLGRDALAQLNFTYDGGGVWTMGTHRDDGCHRPSLLGLAGAVAGGHLVATGIMLMLAGVLVRRR
jgi:hypothetical protein